MELWSMIWPAEWALRVIIFGLWCVIGLAVWQSFKLYNRIRKNLVVLEQLSTRESILGLENAMRNKRQSPLSAVADFENYYSKNDDNEPVFEHLRAIFEAGYKSSRLDADLLVKNTVNKVCDNVDIIKSFISVFLVIGILGTLVGLAISIGSFNGDSFLINAQANHTAAELSALFSNLRGAFAPSMWGVGSTIIFVLAYTMCIQQSINKLENKLTADTIKVWLPVLYPTDFQKGENTMIALKETIQDAGKINESSLNLLENIDMANDSVKAIMDVSGALNSSIEKFEAGSEKISELEKSVALLKENIEANNSSFQQWFVDAVQNTTKYQADGRQFFLDQAAALRENFDLQNKQVQEMVLKLSLYDENAFKTHENLNHSLLESIEQQKQILEQVKTAANDLDRRNKNIIDAVGVPLQSNLQDISEHLNNTLGEMTKELQQTTKAMDRIGNPLQDSADDISRMIGNIIRDNDTKMQAFLASQSGMNAEQIAAFQKSMSMQNGSYSNEKIEKNLEKLDATLQNMTNISLIKNDSFFGSLQRYMPVAIAVLLFVSIIIQGMMVCRIGDLQKAQENINYSSIKSEASMK